MDIKYLRKELNDYSMVLAKARLSERIPHFWVKGADHLTYQVRSPRNLKPVLDGLRPHAKQITCIEQDGPFEVAVRLLGPLALTKKSRIEWVRFKEIDRETDGSSWEGISALNVLVDSLDTIKSRVLTSTNLYATAEDDRIEIKLNNQGQTYNFVEVPLGELTNQRIDDGIAIPIFPKKASQPDGVRSQEQ